MTGREHSGGRLFETLSAAQRRRIPRWIGWPLLALWTYFVLGYFAESAKFHPSPYPQGPWDVQAKLDTEDVWLTTSDGVQIHGWRIGAGPDAELMTLYLHGNGGNISHRGQHLSAIRAAGSHLLIIDYRGYGKSKGNPTEAGIYLDADAAHAYLKDQGYQSDRIILHGESLGTAVAADLAARQPCAGVILEAPFTSARAVAAYVLPVIGPLVVSGLETERKIRDVTAPVFVIQGDRDATIPHVLGQQVFEAANEPKQLWTIPGAGHNDIVEVAGPEYVERLKQFYAGLKR